MRRRRVKRSKARGQGVGRRRHRYTMYANSLSTRERMAAFLDFSTLRPGFKKVCLQALCLQDPRGRSAKKMPKNVHLHTEAFPCGWPLTAVTDIYISSIM